MGDGKKVRLFYNDPQKWIFKNKFNLRSLISSKSFISVDHHKLKMKCHLCFCSPKKKISKKFCSPHTPLQNPSEGWSKLFLNGNRTWRFILDFGGGYGGTLFFWISEPYFLAIAYVKKLDKNLRRRVPILSFSKNFWT